MTNKNKPVFQKHNQNKWKIVEEGKETPFIYNQKKMIFRTKGGAVELERTIRLELPFLELEIKRL